jgi:hypothetical protein
MVQTLGGIAQFGLMFGVVGDQLAGFLVAQPIEVAVGFRPAATARQAGLPDFSVSSHEGD